MGANSSLYGGKKLFQRGFCFLRWFYIVRVMQYEHYFVLKLVRFLVKDILITLSDYISFSLEGKLNICPIVSDGK